MSTSFLSLKNIVILLVIITFSFSLPSQAEIPTSLEAEGNNLNLRDKLNYFTAASELVLETAATTTTTQPKINKPAEIPTSLGFNITQDSLYCRAEAKPSGSFRTKITALLSAYCGLGISNNSSISISNYTQENWNRVTATYQLKF
jgi:hypothetical protein